MITKSDRHSGDQHRIAHCLVVFKLNYGDAELWRQTQTVVYRYVITGSWDIGPCSVPSQTPERLVEREKRERAAGWHLRSILVDSLTLDYSEDVFIDCTPKRPTQFRLAAFPYPVNGIKEYGKTRRRHDWRFQTSIVQQYYPE